VLDAAEHGAEDRQQARPGVPAALEDLLGFGLRNCMRKVESA
jgi:hypothetical protein